jgi:hypothetical protein
MPESVFEETGRLRFMQPCLHGKTQRMENFKGMPSNLEKLAKIVNPSCINAANALRNRLRGSGVIAIHPPGGNRISLSRKGSVVSTPSGLRSGAYIGELF